MGRHHHESRRHRKPGRLAVAVGTYLLGGIGLLLTAWLVFSFATGAQIVMFRTGSMSPTMPTGSAVISLPVDAADIRIGDVLTVQRGGGALPVTHRVVQLGPTTGAGREVILQGDANSTPDTRPYQVDRALRMAVTVPGLGPALTALHTPAVTGALTVLAAGVVGAAFWPRGRTDSGQLHARELIERRSRSGYEPVGAAKWGGGITKDHEFRLPSVMRESRP